MLCSALDVFKYPFTVTYKNFQGMAHNFVLET